MAHHNVTAALLAILLHMSVLLSSTQAAQEPAPMSGVRCPPGRYVTSTGRCTPCPAGTFQPHLISKIGPESCTKCSSGFYCSTEGLTMPEGPCIGGYYCLPGSTSPTDRKCEPNHHCPEGIGFMLACPPGTSSLAGAATLQDCTKQAKKEL